jgi:anaerobic selenocysteine-containing dehydrogenase
VQDADWIKVEAAGGSGSCQLKAKVTEDTLPDVLTTGVGWWRPDAPAPHFGAHDININAALSYRARWDLASGSADTGGIPCQIVI